MSEKKLTLTDEEKEKWEKKHYGIAGNHSAVQICSWTKKALRNEGTCYKHKFYGIHTHKCAEMTPTVSYCQQNCIFCWRPMEYMRIANLKDYEVDDPKTIIEEVIKQRKRLLTGFGGNEKVDKELLKDALTPDHYAISLSGEPTLYPKLLEMFKYLKEEKNARSIFLVTNAQEPEFFKKMIEKNIYPTQLYVSIDAPNKTLFKKINHSLYKDGWERLKESLKILSKADVRRVIRFTMIKNLNDLPKYIKEYAKLFRLMNTDFIEVKAYMYLGLSRRRLTIENMPTHKEVRDFAKLLEKEIPEFKIIDEHEPSRIVLLHNKNSKYKEKIDFKE